MSLTSALNTAVAALRVNQAQMQLISANVAHANDPNYSRKTLQTASVALGPGQIGSVEVSGYQNAVSASLQKQLVAQTADSGASSATDEYMSRVQDLFGTSTDQATLSTAMTAFTTAWQQLQSNPESEAAQQQVVATGQRIADEVHRLAAGLDQIDNDVRTDIGQSVNQLNDLLKQVFDVNLKLKQTQPNSAERGDLLDTRDKLVQQIAQYVDVRTVQRDDGSISLFTASGLQLMDGPPALLAYDGTNVYKVEDGTPINSQLQGGRIHALLNFRQDSTGSNKPVSPDPGTEVIRKMRAQLDAIVGAFTSTTGTPPTFAAAYDAGSTSQRISASYLTTVDPATSSPQYTTVTLSGTLQTGDVFEVDVNGHSYSYTAVATDTSLDQIAAQLANQINADGTVGVTAIPGVGGLQLVGSSNNTKFTVQTTVNDETTELSGDFFTGTNRFDFQVNAALANGSLQVKRNAASGVVDALSSADRNFTAVGLTLTNVSYQGLMTGIVGNSIANAKTVSDQSKFDSDAMTMSQQRYQSDVGVNLDEEIANLQVVQNAYAASARLLQVVQDMFDTLEQAVAR
ncbi:MAG TPA: flagellar hook-associated protein FlgK [Dongiaceae bacterium]|nr:flagellar hook-associated protein FlgK [Dongiaceae bacterium]